MKYESMTGAQLIEAGNLQARLYAEALRQLLAAYEAGADTCENGETVEAMRYALRMLANNLQRIAVEASTR